MSTTLPFLTTHSVAMPVEFFGALRNAVQETRGASMLVDSVRDAGYHAGAAFYDSFALWLEGRDEAAPESLADERFGPLLSEFLLASGWGEIALTPLSDAVITLDADAWSEAQGDGAGCLVSTGLFAGFFGRLAEAPIAVLEVECRTSGDTHCRFLLGSVDVLSYVHEAMGRGVSYETAASSA